MAFSMIVGHIVLFLAAGVASYGISTLGKEANWPFVLLIGSFIAGIYFLGWWSIITFIAGWITSAMATTNQKFKDR